MIFAPVLAFVSTRRENIPADRRKHLQDIVDNIKKGGTDGMQQVKDRFHSVKDGDKKKPTRKKRTTTKKTTAKKAVAKKTTTRKPIAKKTTAKKPVVKKTTARKTTAKKTSTT